MYSYILIFSTIGIGAKIVSLCFSKEVISSVCLLYEQNRNRKMFFFFLVMCEQNRANIYIFFLKFSFRLSEGNRENFVFVSDSFCETNMKFFCFLKFGEFDGSHKNRKEIILFRHWICSGQKEELFLNFNSLQIVDPHKFLIGTDPESNRIKEIWYFNRRSYISPTINLAISD